MKPLLSITSWIFALAFFAVVPLSGATEIHRYDLNGTYTDFYGGPSLSPNGGTLHATNYTFGPNQGLSLSNALTNTGNYSILIDFSFTDLTGYRRILDFKDRTSDTGLYNLDTALNFYNHITGPPGAFATNVLARMVITRDSTTDVVSGYVNGLPQFSFVDSGGDGIFSGTNGIMNFFIDDLAVGNEASAGLVDRISIYDTPLTAAEVLALGGPGTPGYQKADPRLLCWVSVWPA